MTTYKFKTDETGIDDKTRTIIKTEPVPATTKDTEFSLEQKEKELVEAEQALIDNQMRIDKLKTEIAKVKSDLKIN